MVTKIGLVNPGINGPCQPLGLAYLAGYLRKYGSAEFDIRIFDSNAAGDIVADMIAFGPDMLGFTAYSPQIREVAALSKEVRGVLPAVYQIIGGVHVSADPVYTLKRGAFDAAVLGEGEKTFLEAAEYMAAGRPEEIKSVKGTAYLEEDTGVVNEKRSRITDLDTIPFPSRDLFRPGCSTASGAEDAGGSGRASVIMTGSRGCPYDCFHCSAGVVSGKARHFSVDYRVAEIEDIVGRYGDAAIYLVDDTFFVNKLAVHQLCESIIKKGLAAKVRWTAQARANLIGWQDMELLRLMRSAGCAMLEFGFDSGSDEVLAILKQKMVTVEDNQRSIDVTHAAGLHVKGSFMVGVPGETSSDLEKTREFVRRNLPKIDSLHANICTPYPGSRFYETCMENALVDADYFVEAGKREDAVEEPVYTGSVDAALVRDTFRYLNCLGLRKLSLRDRVNHALHHLVGAGRSGASHDWYDFFKLF